MFAFAIIGFALIKLIHDMPVTEYSDVESNTEEQS